MNDSTILYIYSVDEARRHDEMAIWRASYHANIACKAAIEQSIRAHFDGMHLNKECLQEVLSAYGYRRTGWVLANTIQIKEWDGRFSPQSREWAKKTYIPEDRQHNSGFVVETHPAVLDGFVSLYRKAYQALSLFGPEHCEPDSRASLDYTGRVLVLSPNVLKESYWSQANQLWLAHDGFGCSPRAVGRSIRCTCLGDGEQTCWNRADFCGVLKPEFLPNWAAEKLNVLQNQNTGIGGMAMT